MVARGSRKRGLDVKVITSGRTDLDEYFRLSGIREHKKLVHSLFLAFLISGDTVEVRIVDNARTLLDFADETQVMSQWRGQWRSDYFHFKVGDLRRYVAEHPAEKYHVV